MKKLIGLLIVLSAVCILCMTSAFATDYSSYLDDFLTDEYEQLFVFDWDGDLVLFAVPMGNHWGLSVDYSSGTYYYSADGAFYLLNPDNGQWEFDIDTSTSIPLDDEGLLFVAYDVYASTGELYLKGNMLNEDGEYDDSRSQYSVYGRNDWFEEPLWPEPEPEPEPEPVPEPDPDNALLSSVVSPESFKDALKEVCAMVLVVVPVVAGLFGIRKGLAFLISKIRGV